MRINLFLLAVATCFTTLFSFPSHRLRADEATTRPVDQAALEKQFADLLTDATMAGKYSIEGSDAAPRDDRYHLIRAVKADGDNWAITSRIEYKGLGFPITLTIPVKWAGDTPVIEVTNQVIPGFGTFTARVMFYDGHYMGTWSGGKGHAGMMWGKIEHGNVETQPSGEAKGSTTNERP